MSDGGDATVDNARIELLAKAMLVAGVIYPLWFALTPDGAKDSLLLWIAVGAVMMAPATLVALVPATRPHLGSLCGFVECLLTTKFFVLAALNDAHAFYAIGAALQAANAGFVFQRRPALLMYIGYVALLGVATALASDWAPIYALPVFVALALAYWHLNHRTRAEMREARHRDDLERLVDQRTAELRLRTEDLAEANERLSREIAERERVERSLRVWQRLQAMARLAGGVAHDFNNLLTTITVYSELLRDRLPAGSSEARDAEEVCRAAERATALTGQLLAFSRDASLENDVVDLNEVLRDARTIVHSVSAEDIEVVMDLAPFSVDVRGNRAQFEQVVANLTANARDAMPDGGVLHIETRVVFREELAPGELPGDWSADPVALLRVRDTGVGMDEETLQHVFDPFFTTKEVGKGTGLGLAAVYGIVQQGHGWIRVESRPGEGTEFTVYWPSDASNAEVAGAYEELADATAVAPSSKPQILVVDDEPSLRMLVARILEEDGCDVVTVADAEAALEAVRDVKRRIDLMVTDVVLPRHNGIDLWREADRLRPGMRVLFISGHLHHPSLASRELPPGLPLLPKPFSSRVLIDEVRSVLGASATHSAYR